MSDQPENTLIVTWYVHEEEEDEESQWRAAGVRSGLKVMMRIHEAVKILDVQERSTDRYILKTSMTPEELFRSLRVLIDETQDRLEITWTS